MDRRSLLDGDMTPTQENRNIFDDEFEVEDFDMIADGFRPGQSHDREESERQDLLDEDVPVTSVSARYASIPVSSAGPSRNSTRKSRSHENPFASPEDDGAPLERTPSGNFAPASHLRRSVSSASSHQYVGTSSPRFGAGPSHPYSMYPQGTVARTPSVATTSTARPTRQSSSRYAPAPQHPYALYPQGVGDDLDDEHEAAQNPVPVGFLGLGQSYQRRRGPDGEEVDILGEYGHTEQLPPYTRYPEDGPEKAPLLGVPNPPTELHSRAPVLGTDPGMDLMHQQIRPAQQSMTDQSNLARQNSTMSRASGSPSSAAASSPQDSLLPEKTWAQKSWSERRGTKFCGIPFRWLMVFVALIFFGVVVMGGVMGGYLAGKKNGESAADYRSSSSLYDASLITASSGTPPPTGTYPLALGLPRETQAACLTNDADKSAWSCDLVDGGQIDLVIGRQSGGSETGAWLETHGVDTTQLSYGSQIQNMDTKYARFQYVRDNDAPQDGPAFYFQHTYNKLVVVPENDIDAPSRKFKRDPLNLEPGWTIEKQYATSGDKPWFCYWNETLLEGFIFTKRKATHTSSSSSTSSTSSRSSITPPPPMAKSTSGSYNEYSKTMPWSISGAQPYETVTTVLTMPTTTCTYTGVASAFPQWMQHNYPDWLDYKDGDEGKGDEHHPPGSPKRKLRRGMKQARDDDADSGSYEYLVKIEERRCPDSNPPVCVQYQVLNSGAWNWIPDKNGAQISVTLAESDPPYAAYEHSGSRRQKRAVKGGCHCEWL